MLSLCRGLLSHPNIRRLEVYECELSSNSCETLSNLIPTLSQLKLLDVYVDELSKPETEPIKLLKLTADQYAIEFVLLVILNFDTDSEYSEYSEDSDG